MNSDHPPQPISKENPENNQLENPNSGLQPMSQLQNSGFPNYNAMGPFLSLTTWKNKLGQGSTFTNFRNLIKRSRFEEKSVKKKEEIIFQKSPVFMNF